MANDIAVVMNLQSRGYVEAMRQSMVATENYSRSVGRAKVNFLAYEKGLQRATQMTGQNRMVLQNSIYMVEDAASVYGTMGFAGAVRAASNNLTVMAGAFGPWGMAATVATTTALQLYMALTKDKEAAEDASHAMKDHVEKLKEQSEAAMEASKANREFREGSREDLAQKYQEAKGKIEDTKAALNDLNEQQRKLVATKPFVVAEQGGGDKGRQAFEEQLNNIHAERRRLQEEYNKALEQSDKIREKLNKRTHQSREAQVEVMGIVKENAKINDELAKNKQRDHQGELARQKDQRREESNRRFQKLLEDREREQSIKRRQDMQRKAREEELRARNPSGARMGDREFLERMAKLRQQGFVGPDLSQRQQQSIDTMQKNKDRLQQDDLRGGFDKRRQETIAEIDKQIQSVKDAARGRQQKTEDRDNKQAALDKATQENTKQQKMTVAALDRLAEEIQRRAADREQSGRMVQIGGLTL